MKNIYVFFVLVFVVFLTVGCAAKHAQVTTVRPIQEAVQTAPAQATVQTAVPIQQRQEVPVGPAVAPVPAVQLTAAQTQTVVIGEIQKGEQKSEQVKVNIPTSLPSQPESRMTDGQILTAIPYIQTKLQKDPLNLGGFNLQLGNVQGGTQRPQMEQLLLSFLDASDVQTIKNMKIVEPMVTPDQVEIAKTVPNPQDYQELHLGKYPVTRGNPFTSPDDYRDDAQNILQHLAKIVPSASELESAKEAFNKCFEGGPNYRTNPLWMLNYCRWVSASEYPYVEQTTGGVNIDTGRETGVTTKVKCTEECAKAMVFAFLDPKTGVVYIFYNICRGNPAKPVQRIRTTYTALRQEALCKELTPTSFSFLDRTQTINLKVNTEASPEGISNVRWTLDGQPFNGQTLTASLNEKQVPRGKESVVAFDAMGFYPSIPGQPSQPAPLHCEVRIKNEVPVEKPAPVCTSASVTPRQISDPTQRVRFEVSINETGRVFIPVVYKDGVEIYRGAAITNFQGVVLASLFTAEEIRSGKQSSHQLTFKAIDPATNAILFECSGGTESLVTFIPPECPCKEISGEDEVRLNKPAMLVVKRDSTGPRAQGYWRFQADAKRTSLSTGDTLTMMYNNFELVFHHPPSVGGEKAVVEFVDIDKNGKESVNPKCVKVITFYPPKEVTHHGICGPHAWKCVVPILIAAGGICAKVCINTNAKVDVGRVGVNNRTIIDEEQGTWHRVWRLAKPIILKEIEGPLYPILNRRK